MNFSQEGERLQKVLAAAGIASRAVSLLSRSAETGLGPVFSRERHHVVTAAALLVLLGADSVVRLLAANERCELLDHVGQTLSLNEAGSTLCS